MPKITCLECEATSTVESEDYEVISFCPNCGEAQDDEFPEYDEACNDPDDSVTCEDCTCWKTEDK